MRLLLDTHLLVWAGGDDGARPRLSRDATRLMRDGRSELFFSVISIWEVAIKAGRRRADFGADPEALGGACCRTTKANGR